MNPYLNGFSPAGAALPVPLFPTNQNQPPKKFIKKDGVMHINPEYQTYMKSTNQKATTVKNPDQAMPVITTMNEFHDYRLASRAPDYEAQLAPSVTSTLKILGENEEVVSVIGLDYSTAINGLEKISQKHEIPFGLTNKLLILQEYELLFIIDDSGSMGNNSDARDDYGRIMSRSREALQRLKEMFEILAHIPVEKMTVRFFNRPDILEFKRHGETPRIFLEHVYKKLDQAFEKPPEGGTPAYERLMEAFDQSRGKKVMHYFFCDGKPNGEDKDKYKISDLLIKRRNPEDTPISLISCTNKDSDVEWMKEVEEVAPYCAEYDDFAKESEEVACDQGPILPFTKGFYLLCQLVGPLCPEDLDAMDESIPFTKWTYDNLLGVETSVEEYRRYFNGFLKAQNERKCITEIDRIKKQTYWNPLLHSFETIKLSKDIPAVKQFRDKLKQALLHTSKK